MEIVVKLEDVSKVYESKAATVVAASHVNLSIEKGSFTSIIGKSGSGKSTILHLMGALDVPTGGRVLLNGRDLSGLSDKELSAVRREGIGFVFQQYRLLEEFNLWDNICVPSYLGGKEPDAVYIEELLKAFGLWERRRGFPAELSGGQQQRVAVIRAMAHKPAVILADEPTGNLDSETSKELMELLEITMKRYEQTLVLVTHDKELAARAERLIEIVDGCVLKDEIK